MSDSLPPTPIANPEGERTAGSWRWLPAVAWVIYVGYLLLSPWPPGESLLRVQPDTLREAVDLSLNFWFVLPLAFPDAAPTLNPVLEGLFNGVVAWGLLFWGFLIDGRHQRWPMLPFLVGTAFLTNVFYLPWLALRSPTTDPISPPLSPLERGVESRGWPTLLLVVAIAAGAWAVWGRPGFDHGVNRWADFRDLLGRDRLAYSFMVDAIVFWLFQGWLVTDDMTRRQWHHRPTCWIACLLPFLGLIIYFWRRPSFTQPAATPMHDDVSAP
jgi:hypothetical protein